MVDSSDVQTILKSKPTVGEFWRSVPYAFRLIYDADRISFFKILIFSSIMAPVAFMHPFAMKEMTDGVLQHSSQRFWLALCLSGATALLGAAAEGLRDRESDVLRFNFERYFELRTMRFIARIPVGTHEDAGFRELFQAFREKRHVILNLVDALMEIPVILFTLIGAATVAVFIPWYIFPLLAFSFLFRFILMSRVAHLNWNVMTIETGEGRRAHGYRHNVTHPHSASVTKTLGLMGYFIKRWDALFLKLLAEKMQIVTASAKASAVGEAIRHAGGVIGMAVIGAQILSGGLSLSILMVFGSAYGQVSGAAVRLAWMISRLQKDWMFLTLFQRFFATPTDKKDGLDVPDGPLTVEFHGVSFRYPEGERDALHDVSLTLKAGEAVALTGKNGAGKTTLLKLLMGVYTPTKGSILVNGVDLRLISPAAWHEAMSMVTQRIVTYEDSLRELVRQGQIDTETDMNRMEAVARSLTFDRVLAKHTRGWDTQIGENFVPAEDKAVQLSGGEMQLLVILRHLYRSRASIYVFDEAASNLDVDRRPAFYKAVAELFPDKIVVFSTHDHEAQAYVTRTIELPSSGATDAEYVSIQEYQTKELN